MNKTLLTQALIKFLAGILLIGLLVFLPAGSFAYWQGWLLMGVLFVPMFFAGIVMLAKKRQNVNGVMHIGKRTCRRHSMPAERWLKCKDCLPPYCPRKRPFPWTKPEYSTPCPPNLPFSWTKRPTVPN